MKLSANMPKSLLCTALASCCVYSVNVLADATITFEEKSPQYSGQNVMLLKDGKVRFTPSDQSSSYSIYNSQDNKLTHIEPMQKKYLEMSKQEIELQAKQAKQQMEMMRKEMETRMQELPPEQRKQAEQMMQNYMPEQQAKQKPPEVKQVKTSRTETIAGINCDVYESSIKDQKISESCITTIDKLGLNKQDLDSLEKMQVFMKDMQQAMTEFTGKANVGADVEGLPLRSKLFDSDGSTVMETRLISINKDSVAAEKVDIPAEYTPIQMPQMPQ